MENKSNEFFKDLDIVVQENWEKLKDFIIDSGVNIYEISYGIELTKEKIDYYDLNDNFEFHVQANPHKGGKIKYLFKGLEVNPECYYLRRDSDVDVSTLRMLQECVKQDTHEPDIRFLEREYEW